MNIERIKEIQKNTAYPDSTSVMEALIQVWNECSAEKSKNSEVSEIKKKENESLVLKARIKNIAFGF